MKLTSIRFTDAEAARLADALAARRRRTGANVSQSQAIVEATDAWAAAEIMGEPAARPAWALWSGEDPRRVAPNTAAIVIWTPDGTAHAAVVLNEGAWGVSVDHPKKGYRTIGRDDAWPAGWVWCARPGRMK